jgi:hypothetical protein
LTTRLDRPLKRELSIDGAPYTLTVSTEGMHLAPKGRRKGQELKWKDLVSGDAALATALNASLSRTMPARPAPPEQSRRRPKAAKPAKRKTRPR